MPRRFHIQTVGCQMNVLDSELVAAELLRAGYELVDSPRQADVILLNTCSVRQHAEDKIYSALGRLKSLKDRQPEKIIGVLGCMAQKDRHHIFQRAPHVDLVVGPGQLGQLPALLEQVAAGGGPRIEVSLDRTAGSGQSIKKSFARFVPSRSEKGPEKGDSPRPTFGWCPPERPRGCFAQMGTVPFFRPANTRPVPYQAMVRIMFGCDKFCTYCIVPRVRGPEQSRPAAEILDEVRRLADDGCLEFTLLGQTVNSYQDATGPRTVHLADLLYMLHDIEGMRRLKFVTNHPRHMTDDLLHAMCDLPKVSPYLHIPAQSGSNAVLRRMKRGYTAESYREMLGRIRQAIPRAAVTSDFIVGFCGESEEEFQQTVDLVRNARFKNSFIFKYSARPGTKAAELYKDDVPESVKRRRNNELLAVQNAISLEDSQPLLGRTVEILVEGPSKVAKRRARTHPDPLPAGEGDSVQLVGRTVCDQIVVFDGPPTLTGRILPVVIEKVDAFTLFGRQV